MGKEVNTYGPFRFSIRTMNAMHTAGFSLYDLHDEEAAADIVGKFYAWCMRFQLNDDGSFSARRNWTGVKNFGRKSFHEVEYAAQSVGRTRVETREAFGYDVPLDVYRWLKREVARRSVGN